MRSIFLTTAFLVACVGGDDSSTIDAGPDVVANKDVTTNDVTTNDVAVDSPLVCDGGSTVMACNGSAFDRDLSWRRSTRRTSTSTPVR